MSPRAKPIVYVFATHVWLAAGWGPTAGCGSGWMSGTAPCRKAPSASIAFITRAASHLRAPAAACRSDAVMASRQSAPPSYPPHGG
jgi:hypothetical protein